MFLNRYNLYVKNRLRLLQYMSQSHLFIYNYSKFLFSFYLISFSIFFHFHHIIYSWYQIITCLVSQQLACNLYLSEIVTLSIRIRIQMCQVCVVWRINLINQPQKKDKIHDFNLGAKMITGYRDMIMQVWSFS